MEEVTADVLEIAKELEFKMQPGVVTKFQLSHDKILMDEDLLLMVNTQRVGHDFGTTHTHNIY